MQKTLVPHQIDKEQGRADYVGEHRCQRNACHVHPEDDDKKEIQQDVQDACKGQADQRRLRVSLTPQDRRLKVIEEDHREAKGVDPEIEHCLGQHIVRHRKQPEQRGRDDLPHHHEKKAAQDGQQDGRVHCVPHAAFILRAQHLRDHYVGSEGDAGEEIHHEADDRRVASHRRHGFLTSETTHHGNIGRVKHLLQHCCRRQWQRHLEQLAADAAFRHIYCILCHNFTLAFRPDPARRL